jgi:DNA-binding MarR family transcriptional regulator
MERALKAEGLPQLAWYDAMLEIERAGETPLRPYELEDAMLLPQSNVSRLIDRIEEAGYIEKRTCEIDGRGVFLWITPAGKAMRRRMWPVLSAAIESVIGEKLGDRGALRAAALLRKLAG